MGVISLRRWHICRRNWGGGARDGSELFCLVFSQAEKPAIAGSIAAAKPFAGARERDHRMRTRSSLPVLRYGRTGDLFQRVTRYKNGPRSGLRDTKNTGNAAKRATRNKNDPCFGLRDTKSVGIAVKRATRYKNQPILVPRDTDTVTQTAVPTCTPRRS